MNKKYFLFIAGASIATYVLLKDKKEKYSADEIKKIEEYKQFLEDKDFVIVEKSKFNKLNNNKLLSISSLTNYYSIARTIAKFLV